MMRSRNEPQGRKNAEKYMNLDGITGGKDC